MASPKNKKSKMRKRQRVAQLEKAVVAEVQACPALRQLINNGMTVKHLRFD